MHSVDRTPGIMRWLLMQWWVLVEVAVTCCFSMADCIRLVTKRNSKPNLFNPVENLQYSFQTWCTAHFHERQKKLRGIFDYYFTNGRKYFSSLIVTPILSMKSIEYLAITKSECKGSSKRNSKRQLSQTVSLRATILKTHYITIC